MEESLFADKTSLILLHSLSNFNIALRFSLIDGFPFLFGLASISSIKILANIRSKLRLPKSDSL